MSVIQRDNMSPALGAFLRIGGFSPSMMDQYVPTILAHDLETGPNPPFIPWEVGAAIAAGGAGNFSTFNVTVVNAAPASGRACIDGIELYSGVASIGWLWTIRSITTGGFTAVPIRSTDATQSQDPTFSDLNFPVGTMFGALQNNTAVDPLSGLTNRIWPAGPVGTWTWRNLRIVLKAGQTLLVRHSSTNADVQVRVFGRYYE